MNPLAHIKQVMKCVLIGTLATYCLLVPWGLFGAWFWNTWNGGDGQLPRLEGLPLGKKVVFDALKLTFFALFDWSIITVPAALLIAYRVHRKNAVPTRNQDTNQKP